MDYSFDTNDLSLNEIDIKEWVVNISKNVPLEVLQHELIQLSEIIKGTLIETINQDYNSFVKLSSELSNIRSTVNSYQNEIQETKTQVDNIQLVLNIVREKINEKYQAKIKISERRNTLFSIINFAKIINKIEQNLVNDNIIVE